MRLTDVDALIDDVKYRYCKDCNRRKGIKRGKYRVIYEVGDVPCRACGVGDMIDALDNAPTVDPVKHGHWIDMADFEQCSVCHATRLKELQTYYGKAIWLKTPYCSYCGAKMDEVKDETD